MRLSIALGGLAGGLVLGSAALALADTPPPAAPIFYCPAAPAAQKAAPAAGKSCPAATPSAPAAKAEHRHERPRYAEGRRPARAAAAREDVSASQAFIYRYERAVHGLNAQAADEAWAHAGPPPNVRDDRRVIREREYAEAPRPAPPVVAPPPAPPERVYVQPAPPPPVVVEVGPTPPARVYVERVAPPPPPRAYAPPCPDRCPMSDGHDGWREHHDDAQAPPAYGRRAYAETAPPPAYSGRVEHYGYITSQSAPTAGYERHEEHYGYQDHGYAYERRETEQSSSWRSSDGHYAEHHDDRRGPCPPSPDHGCSAVADGGYGAVQQYSGRDAYGFLVWPGKSDGQ
jgi:hypothetical protein